MTITKSVFGNYQDQEVILYNLSNGNGMTVKIMNYGATITAITVMDKDGKPKNITCGFDTFEGYFSEVYKNNAPYFGCIVGRYSAQIKDAKFILNGSEYQLANNCGDNNLHGGIEGFDKKLWNAEIVESDFNSSTLKMSLKSTHLEEGFPGNMELSVVFSLSDQNELRIDYSAIPDQNTPISLTNHTYFNLSGFDENIENHSAQVHTDIRLAVDASGAATGEVLNLKGKVDDLRKGRIIKDVHEDMKDGFEHFYVFDEPVGQLKKVANLVDENSDLKLEVSTTEPCMLLYTGKYTSDELARENGDQFGKYRGFCCETHRYPNGPNIENSPKSITKAGEEFKSTTIFKIG